MPNINNVDYINYAAGQTYFVVSDNRLVRRIRYNNLLAQILSQLPSNKTDQDLYTTSTVIFQSIDLVDHAGTSAEVDTAHALNFDYVNSDLGHIKTGDITGALRFGGWDGNSNIAKSKGLGSVNFFAYALEDFQSNGTTATTTNAGTGWSINQQPIGTRLDFNSRRRVVNSRSIINPNPANPPITVFQIGSIEASATPVITTSSNGLYTYNGIGRTSINFVNATIDHFGVPAEAIGTADNPTLAGTNVYTFNSSRTSTFTGRKDQLLKDDTIGVIDFRGYTTPNSVASQGALSAQIVVRAIENFNTVGHGSYIQLRTASSGTFVSPSTRIELQDFRNTYSSKNHTFTDDNVTTVAQFNTSTISLHSFNITNGKFYFPDGTQQTTAWNVTATVPTTSASTGTVGQVAHDSNYIYICVATNSWKRITAGSF